MNRKKIVCYLGSLLLLVTSITIIFALNKKNLSHSNKIDATVLSTTSSDVTVKDKNSAIYTFKINDSNALAGENISIEYTGLLDESKSTQDVKVVSYKVVSNIKDENGIPKDWQDNGIFSDFYVAAYNKLQELSLDEKIGQLFLVRYRENEAIPDLIKYHFGGYAFFEKDFKDKTKEDVLKMINSLQEISKIPLLTAVDEEGGAVVRVSSNPNLASEKFKSSKTIYDTSGFEGIKEDTINKSKLLNSLGLNLNLAPVVDVSTSPDDYIYNRALGENVDVTSTYAKTVIEASKGTGVSYTLKHFPGYGSNTDTHSGSATDERTYEELLKDALPPFRAGIDALAEAVLVSHNTIKNVDSKNPASLSPSVHNILRNELKFTGISMTDDLDMNALESVDNAVVKAILAGNDLIMTTNYEDDINKVKTALSNGTISEDTINRLSFRVLAWKYYKGMITSEK